MDNVQEFTEEYGDYLEDIRQRVYQTALVFVGAFLLGLFSTHYLLPFMVSLLSIDDVLIVASSPFQLLQLAMSAGFLSGILITIPFAFLQAFLFLRGSLLPEERRLIFLLIPLSALLFIIGFLYGFGVMFYAIGLVAQINIAFNITNLWSVTELISELLITSALLGLVFEFPIVLSALIRLRVCSVDFLRRNRRVAFALILVFVALLPPTDGISFLVMSIPLVAIYELTIFGNSFRRGEEQLKV